MKELGRVLRSPRLLLGLALILLVNGFLFARQQRENNYFLDLDLPSSGGVISFDGTFTVTQESVDGKAAYRRYLEWLDRVRGMPPEAAEALLQEEKTALTAKCTGDTDTEADRLDYVAVNNLLRRTDYLTGYGTWLETIQKNKETLLTFAIFNDPGSFSGRNILKTAEEFQKLQGVTLTLGADGAVESLMTYRLTDYFLLLALLLVAMTFLEERKAGLWSVVHAVPRGRLPLALRRTGVLLGTSVLGVGLLYGTDLGLGFFLYGGLGDLDRAVQSVEALGKLPMLTTVGGFLVRYFLLRVGAAFLVGLLLWLLLTAGNNVKYTILVAAGVLAVEYGLYTFLPVQSGWNLFKYFNLFTYLSLGDLYTNYLNIDLFGYPLGIRSISQLALLPLCLLLAAVCIWVHCHKTPAEGRDLLGRAAYRLNSLTDRGLGALGLMGMELHKTLWLQKGVVVAALLIYGTLGLRFTVTLPPSTPAEQMARQYTAEFAGEITGDTFARMDAEQASLEAAQAAYEQAQRAYDSGEISYPELDRYARDASSAEVKGQGLATVRARCEELQTRGAAEGFAPWLVDEIPFESVYGSSAQYHQHQAALTALLALTLLLAGSMAYERQGGMVFLLRSTPRGRRSLVFRKLLLGAMMATLVWGVVYGMELYTLLTKYSVSAWNAPARNLAMLPAFPTGFSIGGWLGLLYTCRWLALFSCGVMVLWLSQWGKRVETACIAACAGMLLPSLLNAYLGIQVLRPLSVILPVEAMPLLLAQEGGLSALVLGLGALLGLGAAGAARLGLSRAA